MPQVSAIAKMPIRVRQELNDRLLAAGFGDYKGLAEEFTRRGYRIGKSSLHRYGQRLENSHSKPNGTCSRAACAASRITDCR